MTPHSSVAEKEIRPSITEPMMYSSHVSRPGIAQN